MARRPASPQTSPAESGSTAPAGYDGSVLVDASCLQDPAYRQRGIGQHVATILAGRAGTAGAPAAGGRRLVCITNPALPPLGADDRALFDTLHASAYDGPPPLALLNPSPMTHDAARLARVGLRARLRAAIVYDFIPFDHQAAYLSDPAERLRHMARLAWLRRQDIWFAISQDTAARTAGLLGAPPERIAVTGVALRAAMLPPAGRDAPPREWLLAVGGDNWRKNIELVIDAHARSATMAAAGLKLLVQGGYGPERRAELAARHAAGGGQADLLRFLPALPDDVLRDLYARALLAIVPSRAEGFSIPVIEAAAQGTPVLASDIPAHRELLTDPSDRFDPDDAAGLQLRLEWLTREPAQLAAMADRQAGLWRDFSEAAVARRFWDRLDAALAALPPAPLPAAPLIGGRRPRIAFITPLPPARSGVADHSSGVLGALAQRADTTVYSPTRDAVAPAGMACLPLSRLAHLSPRFDAVVSVLGNSAPHLEIFRHLLDHGAAAIAHDSRLLGFYPMLLGFERASAVASAELGRAVDAAEYDGWLGEYGDPPALMLGEVAAAARPLLMHSAAAAELVGARYGVSVGNLGFPVMRVLPDAEISPPGRVAARRALALAEDSVQLVHFGHAQRDRAPGELVWALEMLVRWGIDARLSFVGAVEPAVREELETLAQQIGVAGRVFFTGGFVTEASWRLWLRAADIAVQLRTYGLGQISAGLGDCQAAGVPCVANLSLAAAVAAPDWVRRVPDELSAVLVAETLAGMIEAGAHRTRPVEARAALLAERSFDAYAGRLLAALGLGEQGLGGQGA